MQQVFPCPRCGYSNYTGQRFCITCGGSFEYRCPYCGTITDPETRFCINCGAIINGGMPQQAGWGYPQSGWAPQKSRWNLPMIGGKPFFSSPLILILLAGVLIIIGGLVYWQVGSSSKDNTPPTISSVAVLSKTKWGATIMWKTDEAASSQVEYGRTPSYGSFAPAEPRYDPTTGETGTTKHTVLITGLNAGTTYHFKVISKDVDGNIGKSAGDRTFKTTEPPLYPR